MELVWRKANGDTTSDDITCIIELVCRNANSENISDYIKEASAQLNLQRDLCDQRRLRSACASAQSDQGLRRSHVPFAASSLSKAGSNEMRDRKLTNCSEIFSGP